MSISIEVVVVLEASNGVNSVWLFKLWLFPCHFKTIQDNSIPLKLDKLSRYTLRGHLTVQTLEKCASLNVRLVTMIYFSKLIYVRYKWIIFLRNCRLCPTLHIFLTWFMHNPFSSCHIIYTQHLFNLSINKMSDF